MFRNYKMSNLWRITICLHLCKKMREKLKQIKQKEPNSDPIALGVLWPMFIWHSVSKGLDLK